MGLLAARLNRVSVLVVAGLLARGQSAAQRLLTRVRQDAYTDLVAVSVTIVPTAPTGPHDPTATSWRAVRRRLEPIVRKRLLTPPTAPPPVDRCGLEPSRQKWNL